MNSFRSKKGIIIVFIICITMGFAILSSNLSVNLGFSFAEKKGYLL